MGRFKNYIDQKQILILHGPLGTELEHRGYDISGKLWSAKYLLEKPEIIEDIHLMYLHHGCNIVTTSTYQATLPGLQAAGLSLKQAEEIIRLTVTLAKQARDEFWMSLSDEEKQTSIYPLISGDIGPYAAFLADGSEYTGHYHKVTVEALKAFHRPRIELLLEQGVDLLGIETIPNALEVKAITELLTTEFTNVEAYLSMTAQNTTAISDGTTFAQLAPLINECPQIIAVGFNCSQPQLYTELLTNLRQFTDKPFVTYPNSGEIYDGTTQTWHHQHEGEGSLVDQTLSWLPFGVQIVGGCCRTKPSEILALKQAIASQY